MLKIEKETLPEVEATKIDEGNFWEDFDTQIQAYNRDVEQPATGFLTSETVAPEIAKEHNTEFSNGIVELVNSAIAFVIAKFVVGAGGSTNDYMIGKDSEHRIAKAIARILPQETYFGSPWFTVIVLIGVSYVPILNKAADDRVENSLKKEIREAEHHKKLQLIEKQ